MPTTTTKYALPIPLGSDPINQLDEIWEEFALALEAKLTPHVQGLLANRPAPSTAKKGRTYYATDADRLFVDTGSTWWPVGYLAAFAERLRTVRGSVNADGTIAEGTGFTVDHTGTGFYGITFSTAFGDVVTSTATPLMPPLGMQAGISGDPAPSTAGFEVVVTTAAGVAANGKFHFIAVGP